MSSLRRTPVSRPRHRRAGVIGVLATSALLLAGCSLDAPAAGGGGAASFDEMDEITLKVATLYGPDNWQTTPMLRYTEAVTEASEGKIQFEFFYAGSLVPPAEMASGLRDQLIDLAHIVPVYTASTFPYDNWASQLAYAPDPSPVAGTLQAASATLEWGWSNEDYLAEFEAENLQPLLPRLQTVHSYGLLCKQDDSSLSETQGQRIRVGGEAWAGEVANLGGVTVSMPAAEVYQAFQQGVVDCFMGGPEDTYALGLGDHGKYYNAAGFTGFSSAGVFMSQDSWDGLPLIAQQALWDSLPVFLEEFYASNFAINMEFIEAGGAQGITFVTPDNEFRDAVAEYHDGLSEQIISDAPAVVNDPEAVVNDYLGVHEAWYDTVTGELGFDGDPATWAEWVEVNGTEIPDLSAWAQYLYDSVLAEHRPGGEG